MKMFLVETPCTIEPPRDDPPRIPVWKVNSYEAESLDDAIAQARAFWESQGKYVIGESRETQNNPTPKAR